VNLRAVWAFIAGESRLAPLGIALAIVAALAFRALHAGSITEFVFVFILVGGLVGGVFEKVP